MYLHVGNNKNIREKDIIGIFDMDMCTVSSITKKFLSDAQRNDLVVSAKDEIPKSFVLYKTVRKPLDKAPRLCYNIIS